MVMSINFPTIVSEMQNTQIVPVPTSFEGTAQDYFLRVFNSTPGRYAGQFEVHEIDEPIRVNFYIMILLGVISLLVIPAIVWTMNKNRKSVKRRYLVFES
jgi:hypothetical protein